MWKTYVVIFLSKDWYTHYQGHEIAMLISFINLGRWLEARSKSKAGLAVSKLLNLAPKFARKKNADGDELTYTVVTAPAHGTLEGDAPALTYVPEPGFAGGPKPRSCRDDRSGGAVPRRRCAPARRVRRRPPVRVLGPESRRGRGPS